MLYAKWIDGSDDISLAKAVREQVFVSEQGFAPEQEFDAFDNGAWHVVAMEDETPIGTGRLYIDDGKFTIGRLCVLPGYRNMGIGDALMRLLMDRGLEVGAPALYISAQQPLCGMYEKYGFAQIGEPYQERQHSACNHDGKGGGSAVSRRLRRQLWRRLQRLCGLRRLMIGLKKGRADKRATFL